MEFIDRLKGFLGGRKSQPQTPKAASEQGPQQPIRLSPPGYGSVGNQDNTRWPTQPPPGNVSGNS